MTAKDQVQLKYPPFPPVPPGVTVIPFCDFRENGIRISGLPFGDEPLDEGDVYSNGVEVDGLGIPTVPLRNAHNTDICKTNTRRKGLSEAEMRKKEEKEREREAKKKKEAEDKEKRKDKDILKQMDPIERAQELRRRRILLFAKKEWYELWREGEDLRGKKVYDPDMSIIDRIHLASTEFRTGRTWPPASTHVGYLWDQFRLYAGLLGSPPIWYRTDLQQEPEDVLDDTVDYDDDPPPSSTSAPRTNKPECSSISDDEFDSDEEPDTPKPKPALELKEPQQASNADPMEQRRKRVPARTPYALHNLDPVPVSSEAQVKTLIRLASLRKHTKLLAFLSEPETSIKIFLSWYARKEGLVWSHDHLNALPRLVVFFLELLVRTKAIPESERSLRRAVEVAKRAVDEVPKSGRLCRNLPDSLGVGCRGLWGVRWVEEPFRFTTDDVVKEVDKKEKEEAMKKFEEDLKAENVQVVPAEKAVPPPPLKFDSGDEKDESTIGTPAMQAADISIQVMSPASPGFVEPDTPSYFEEIAEVKSTEVVQEGKAKEVLPTIPPILSPTSSKEPDNPPDEDVGSSDKPESLESEHIPWRWDTDPAPNPAAAAREQQSLIDAWASPRAQPLVPMFGMSVFPLQYEAGLAERSTRRVRAIIAPSEKVRDKDSMRDVDKDSTKKLEEWMERKWKGVQEEMVYRLTRVVLEPWNGFDDGGCADDYRVPKVQTPDRSEVIDDRTEAENAGSPATTGGRGEIHDPEKDTIVILIDPRVADLLSVGMGLSGTWVQIVRKHREGDHGGNRRGRGGYRGRGRGRGRGGPPGGVTEPPLEDPLEPTTVDSDVAGPAVIEAGSESTPMDPSGVQDGTMRGGRGRGRGRGRGGYQQQGGHHSQKEFVFWYVEEVFMVVPSFWTVGEEEEPLKMPDSDEGEENDNEFLDDFED